ncbi:hypothetical protein GSB9_02207 [Flavobacteriaceae bacterium GSB9]|nr:hypothetical protein GSB9_02207 [Flavobacteriaceae bacterium GSB9]
MKKFALLCLALLLVFSCSVEDDGTSYSFEVLPVEIVDIPEEFVMGETYPITVSYYRPSTCHGFKEFYYQKENNQRTVAPINYVFDSSNCETLEDALTDATFNFKVTCNGSYIFKFWQGKNENDESQYLTIEVPVVE